MPYDPRTAHYLSFAEARADFAAGRDTPRAYLERCLEAIARLEPTVQAFVRRDEEAAREAADAASARWRAGRPLSAIDGMPVAIKDCYDVAGMPTEVGSRLFEGDVAAALDAAHVAALRQGGAIIVGKTTTTELTMALPAPTWNPWDLTRTPGGSSSGSAAAVAASMLPLATGSQVRGSTIRPASICGIVGFKPTYGALNRYGGFDPSPSLNHLGILAGTLSDAWQAAHWIAATVGGDPGYPALAGGAELPAARRPARLARQYTYGWRETDEASKAEFEAFLRRLAQGRDRDRRARGERCARRLRGSDRAHARILLRRDAVGVPLAVDAMARAAARQGQRGDRGVRRARGEDDAARIGRRPMRRARNCAGAIALLPARSTGSSRSPISGPAKRASRASARPGTTMPPRRSARRRSTCRCSRSRTCRWACSSWGSRAATRICSRWRARSSKAFGSPAAR